VFVKFISLSVIAIAIPVFACAEDPKSSLSGSWTSDCLPIGKNGRHGYITRISFHADTITTISQIYAKRLV